MWTVGSIALGDGWFLDPRSAPVVVDKLRSTERCNVDCVCFTSKSFAPRGSEGPETEAVNSGGGRRAA